MISIEKRLKELGLLDEAIANEDDSWGNTPEEWEAHLVILMAGRAFEDDDNNYTCLYTKIDGSICGKNCTRIEGCHVHWHRENKESGVPCKKCGKFTRITFGYCHKHASGHRYRQHKLK